jgi:hypothetical protein
MTVSLIVGTLRTLAEYTRDPAGILLLYDFQRVAALMTGRPTVQHVVDEACSFGREDDITVVSITRMAVGEPEILISLSPHLAPG